MANEKGVINVNSFKTKISLLEIHVLVVDEDSKTRSIVSSYLRTWNYNVEAVRDPNEVMNVIETKQGKSFDLVISDLHMSTLHGLELQKQIHKRFEIPVIFMSSDNSENVILHCLQVGAALYLVKPICLDDVKNVWQYAIGSRKGKCADLNQIRTFSKGASVEHKKDCKRKASTMFSEEDEDKHIYVAPKKAKVVWTTSLHTRFLRAIKFIGFHKAAPKKILKFMNVPGLSRDNVASHLQKYRIFLKRVTEMRIAKSKEKLDMNLYYPKQYASKGNSLLGYGNKKFPLLQPYSIGNNMSLSSGASSDLMNNASSSVINKNSMQMYPQHAQASPRMFTTGTSSGYNFGTSPRDMTPNYSPRLKNTGSYNSDNPTKIFKSPRSTNVGQQMKTDGDEVGMDQMQFFGGYGSIYCNMNIAPLGNSSYLTQRGSSSAGFQSPNHFQPIFTSVTEPALSVHQYGFNNQVEEQGGVGVFNNLANSSHLAKVKAKTSSKNHNGERVFETNFGANEHGDEYFPCFDQNHNQEKGDEELALELVHMYLEDNNLEKGNLSVDQVEDDEFVNSLLDAFSDME